MAKFLGVNLPKELNRALGKLIARAVLVKTTQTTHTVGSLTGSANATTISHRCRAFFDDWPGQFPTNQTVHKGTDVVKKDRMITILGDSLRSTVVPSKGDQIIIKGETWNVMHVGGDAAESVGTSATYKCQCRGA